MLSTKDRWRENRSDVCQDRDKHTGQERNKNNEVRKLKGRRDRKDGRAAR